MSDLLHAQTIAPGSFEPTQHFYPQVLNAHIHPMVRFFFSLGNERLARRYCHLNPEADLDRVRQALSMVTQHMRWGGADLFYTTDERGARHMVVIETNSSPSGQKSMPVLDDWREDGGYRLLLERAFLPMLRRRTSPKEGGLAILHDKNMMETSGYAAALAELTGEHVWHVPWFHHDVDPPARFDQEGMLHVRDEAGAWHPIRGAIKYVTQRPWTRIPPTSRTVILNSSLVCLAGGRNKLLASKAYDIFNGELAQGGLKIHYPETIWDVSLQEIPMWVKRMGGVAVVKVPYSNAGQGVYTITSQRELDAFMALDQRYDQFIVQALIGNVGWSSRSAHGRLYHVGTVPDRQGNIHVADLRVMVGCGEEGFFPVALYARRARQPLADALTEESDSWQMLGTNLSIKQQDSWDTDTDRLLLMDSRNFNRLGLGFDDLVEAYIQTVLSVTAIDDMCQRLLTSKGRFRRKLFSSINPDPMLVSEICVDPATAAASAPPKG